jgi:hypothetical protein
MTCAAVVRLELHLPAGQQFPVTLQRCHAGGLEQGQDAAGHASHDAGLALLHGRQVERHTAEADAVHGEFRLRAVQQLRGLEQRLRGNAARVQAGAAERRRAVEILPLVDAGHGELVLRGADRGRVAGRAATDHDDVEVVSHVVLESVSQKCEAGMKGRVA